MLYGMGIFIFFLIVIYCVYISQNYDDNKIESVKQEKTVMDYERKLELLDKILEALYNPGTHQIHYKDMNRETYKNYLKHDNPNDIESTFIAFVDPSNELGNALEYLEKDNYISLHEPFVNINFKGILKLSDGGFVQEYKRTKLKNRKDDDQYARLKDFHQTSRTRNIVMMVLGVIGFVISLITLMNQLNS